jgi:hypothetical protein
MATETKVDSPRDLLFAWFNYTTGIVDELIKERQYGPSPQLLDQLEWACENLAEALADVRSPRRH